MKISGSFIAAGGEKYITIGNFKNDSLSSIRYLGQLSSVNAEATYYIDDVIVSPDSNYADSIESVQNINAKKTIIKAYPNPANSLLNIETQIAQGHIEILCVYNSLGQQVCYLELLSNTTILPISSFIPGIYYYRVTNSAGTVLKEDKLLIIH
jgi:hypothetical protein